MKKIMVTGGAGFIGANFILMMLEKYADYHLVNVDKLTYAGNLENLTDAENHQNYTFYKADICDKPRMTEIMEKESIDAVVNFAAESHVDRSIEGPDIFVHTNVLGTLTLLQAGKEAGIERFHQISTDEVYGSLGTTGYFTETTPYAPSSPYSASKAGADMLVRAFHKTYGMNTVITNCSNNYGPYQFPEKLIPLMINNALHDKSLPIYGDGKNVRDWLHVRDHCAAIDLVLHKGTAGETYNIGGNSEMMNIDIVKRILARLEKPESLIEFVTDRLGHDRRYAIDAGKIKRELGWEPSYTFDQGIKETIDWYMSHETWVKEVTSGEYQHYYERLYGDR